MKNDVRDFISKFSFNHSIDETIQEESQELDQEVTYTAPVVKKYAKPNSSIGSVITDSVVIKGSISTSSNIEIAGIVEGDVASEGNVIVSGKVLGNITGVNIDLKGCEIIGNVASSMAITQDQKSVVTGDITAVKLEIAGVVNGSIVATEGVVLHGSASVVGNIEAQSISVIEGAAVNGKIQIATK